VGPCSQPVPGEAMDSYNAVYSAQGQREKLFAGLPYSIVAASPSCGSHSTSRPLSFPFLLGVLAGTVSFRFPELRNLSTSERRVDIATLLERAQRTPGSTSQSRYLWRLGGIKAGLVFSVNLRLD
jgi:hypothetical protein